MAEIRPLLKDATLDDVRRAANTALGILRGNIGGHFYLQADDGIKRDIRGGAVLSSTEFALKIRSGAGYHLDVRDSTDLASRLRVTDAIVSMSVNTVEILGTTPRISAELSNATLANRLHFQTYIVNGASSVGVIPNGSGTTGDWTAYNNAAPGSATVAAVLRASSSAMELRADSPGASYKPMEFYTSGTKQMSIGTGATGSVVDFPSTARRITGDFSNGTAANRLMFQSNTVNGITAVSAIPNGTGTTAAFVTYNSSNPAAASYAFFDAAASEIQLISGHNGASYLPIVFYTNNAEAGRWETGGSLLATLGFKNSQRETLLGVISPTQITADTDDWNPTGLSTARIIRIDVDAPHNITGLVAQAAGTIITLHNTSLFTITLVHDLTSTAANRFRLSNTANYSLTPFDSIELMYDGPTSRWVRLS